jgi:hypothetical protein
MNLHDLTDGYVMCVVYKIAVIAVMGYMWEEFEVLFIFFLLFLGVMS